ncbi:MAG TPA: zf-HC2 domain-containing protein [Steroidobacteraceae bacterium]
MTPAERPSVHEEAWLLLPWLANGRLSESQRDKVQEHLQSCAACAAELQVQHRLHEALSAPDRVTYAPGPSFRKLLDRLDDPTAVADDESAEGAQVIAHPAKSAQTAGRPNETIRSEVSGRSRAPRSTRSLWRPPGLAWAASFILMVSLTVLAATAYRWSEPRFITVTDRVQSVRPGVLHVAFDKGLTIGEVEEMLRVSGARVVEGPDSTGIFGIAPADRTGSVANDSMANLAARMRTDPRVRWVEPVAETTPRAEDGR